jgi:hypothetical protein
MTTARQIKDRAEAAQAAFEAGQKRLYRSDGQRVYSDAEHRERLRELKAERKRACQEAYQEGTRATEEASRKTEDLKSRDLSALLTPEEMHFASSRKLFVEDELNSMDGDAIVSRLSSVTKSGDRAGQYIHLMAAKKHVADKRKSGRAAVGVGERVRELEEALFGGSAGEELKEAERRSRELGEATILAMRLQQGARTAAESWEARTFRPAG